MKKLLYTLILTTLSTFYSTPYNGFCSVPVADLLGAPISSFFTITSLEKAYKKIPCGEARGYYSSPRIAQLLFNQPVIIKQKKGKEVKIEVPYLPYASGPKTHTTYWTRADAITDLTDNNKKYIPLGHTAEFTLKKPIELNGIWYTAGTRFVVKKKTKRKSTVYLYNPHTKAIDTATIKNSAGTTPPKTFKEKRELFVNLCKEWAHNKNGYIPYVFGGMSIGKPLKKDNFKKEHVAFTKPKPSVFYTRTTKHTPMQGVDCARLFTRAANMCRLPLYATNTKELKKVLRPLKKGEAIENGDLILWNGHVAMISDKNKNLLIEARSYSCNYGKVHEIPYNEQLKGINSTKDLIAAHFEKPRIIRLKKDGSKSHFIYDLELLKLSSLNKTL